MNILYYIHYLHLIILIRQNNRSLYFYMGFLLPQTVKKLPAMQETWVLSLGWEDSLEKEMATHSSIPAW